MPLIFSPGREFSPTARSHPLMRSSRGHARHQCQTVWPSAALELHIRQPVQPLRSVSLSSEMLAPTGLTGRSEWKISVAVTRPRSRNPRASSSGISALTSYPFPVCTNSRPKGDEGLVSAAAAVRYTTAVISRLQSSICTAYLIKPPLTSHFISRRRQSSPCRLSTVEQTRPRSVQPHVPHLHSPKCSHAIIRTNPARNNLFSRRVISTFYSILYVAHNLLQRDITLH